MDLGTRARKRNVEAEFVFGLHQTGKCLLGVVAILVDANRLRNCTACREHRIAPSHREVCASGVVAGKDGEKQDAIRQLTEIDQKSVNYRDAATKAVERIERLIFGAAEIVEVTPSMKLATAERALHNKAPFHRQRNGMGDATLIEAYGEIQRRAAGHYAFVSHNIKDFSNVGVNELEPPPDIAKFFPKSRSRYFTKLGSALNA
ncbi:hypothetical protein ABIA00_003176 [Bradyrhizobium ottawaense]|uniref:PIN domain-containing protein n=1 Tax=Bradyrhizobium ottawaense TaxID=931866 RepID=UPI003837BC10